MDSHGGRKREVLEEIEGERLMCFGKGGSWIHDVNIIMKMKSEE